MQAFVEEDAHLGPVGGNEVSPTREADASRGELILHGVAKDLRVSLGEFVTTCRDHIQLVGRG